MISPDSHPIDLQRILKTLTREELEAYALLSVLTIDQLMKQAGESCSGIFVVRVLHKDNEKQKILDDTLELAQNVTQRIQEELVRDSHRKN